MDKTDELQDAYYELERLEDEEDSLKSNLYVVRNDIKTIKDKIFKLEDDLVGDS